MVLLQISEPEQFLKEDSDRLTIGIDLGTTNSLVAICENGKSKVLSDSEGNPLLSSIVGYYPNNKVKVGYFNNNELSDPKDIIYSVKRFMGRNLKDIKNIDDLPYNFLKNTKDIKFETSFGIKSPEEVSAEILKVLKKRAENFFMKKIFGAVITVPAYFDDAQRQSTKDAARIAGINVLRLINEPTAAAIAYGLDSNSEGVYVVYDLGGGTFDVSILKLSNGIFEVLATSGDSKLGGDDFDFLIFYWIKEKLNLKELSEFEKRSILIKAREIKESLSDSSSIRFKFKFRSNLFNLKITQEDFKILTKNLIAKTINICKNALREINLNMEQIDGVVLVGGPTRMPMLRDEVRSFFKKEPLKNIDPDTVVSIGAAMQASLLAGNKATKKDWLLLDVIPLSLGIETMGGLVEKIIPRNSTIPCSFTQEFTTFKDGQTALSVHVVQGERDLVNNCRSLAKFELKGITPMVAGAARIKVTYQVDADGILSVSAIEQNSGAETSVLVKPSQGLNDKQIYQMLNDSFETAHEDKDVRSLVEIKVEGERIIIAINSALKNDSDLLTSLEKENIQNLIENLKININNSNQKLIKKYIDSLSKATEDFASKRMDRNVRKALTGKNLDKLIKD